AAAENYPDPEHFRININLGWDKLNEYYTKLDEAPAYYASAILNPASRWGYFENTWTDKAQLPWLQEAKRMVKTLWERRKDYPRLSRMALDLLSVPPMSAECERLFSVAGQMVSPLRTRLEASTIGMTQTLRSWARNGLMDAVDTLVDVSDEVGSSIIWETEEDGRDDGE
ncbi:restless-like transposase, partial [Fusarium flagelliforme]